MGRGSVCMCMPNGNALAALYVIEDVAGLMIYFVQDDSALNSVWTLAGQRSQDTANLTPVNLSVHARIETQAMWLRKVDDRAHGRGTRT